MTGQYARGAIDGEPVPGYAEEIGRESQTETFVALKAHIDNWRWKGVPFYLRTGKRMPKRDTRDFHPVQGRALFDLRLARRDDQAQQADHRPSAGRDASSCRLMAKTPGLDRGGVRLREVPLDIGLANAFSEYSPADRL